MNWSKEAIVRSRKDIHIAHIFVAAKNDATAEDVKKAQDKINAAWGQLQKGQDFGKVAAEYSEDPSVCCEQRRHWVYYCAGTSL